MITAMLLGVKVTMIYYMEHGFYDKFTKARVGHAGEGKGYGKQAKSGVSPTRTV